METAIVTKAPQLAARLLELDSAIAGLQFDRFRVLAEMRSIDEADGKSERQTAVTVAQLSRSSSKFAGAEVRLAKKVAALPEVGEALRTNAISAAQLDAVVTIATPETQAETILLAQQSSNADLERAAAVRRGKLAEERQKVQKERFLSFTKHGDQTTIRGSLPHLEGSEIETQLRKIADRLYLGQKDRPAPSARMLDALLIFMKYNPSNSFAESIAVPVADYDEEPFPETPTESTDWFGNGNHTHTEQSVSLVTRAYHANWRQDRYLAHRDGPVAYRTARASAKPKRITCLRIALIESPTPDS
jgi:Domain of unknown function (DUF222)